MVHPAWYILPGSFSGTGWYSLVHTSRLVQPGTGPNSTNHMIPTTAICHHRLIPGTTICHQATKCAKWHWYSQAAQTPLYSTMQPPPTTAALMFTSNNSRWPTYRPPQHYSFQGSLDFSSHLVTSVASSYNLPGWFRLVQAQTPPTTAPSMFTTNNSRWQPTAHPSIIASNVPLIPSHVVTGVACSSGGGDQ
jgi:hypothetical protein